MHAAGTLARIIDMTGSRRPGATEGGIVDRPATAPRDVRGRLLTLFLQ
jgi:hypothetical protein